MVICSFINKIIQVNPVIFNKIRDSMLDYAFEFIVKVLNVRFKHDL